MASSSSESSYSSSSEDSDERRRREKKERKRKREKKEKKERKRKEKKEKHKEKRDKKKRKKSDKDSMRATASGATWGKYGIIRDGDMHEKQEEFLAWLSEVKGVPQEACGQRELKEYFSSFCEDYNTATMPSEKYYNLHKWYVQEQQRKAKQAQAAQGDEGGGFERTSFDDEADRRRDQQRQRTARADETSKLMARAMREGEGLVQDMREQEALKLKMRAAYHTGDVNSARELINKLDPSRIDPEEIKKKFGPGAPSGRG